MTVVQAARQPPPALAATPLGVRLWLFELDDETAPEPALLSAPERERAARFVFERDRRRYLAAHTALRHVLQPLAGLEPGAGYVVSPRGKPALCAPARGSFSLSHSGPWALVGFRPDGEIGVDLEMLQPLPDLGPLAEQNLTAREQQHLAECRGDDARLRAFLQVWTRKEACLKAQGTGLDVAPGSFEVGFDAGFEAAAHAVEFDAEEGQRVAADVCTLQPRDGLMAAVACVRRTHHAFGRRE